MNVLRRTSCLHSTLEAIGLSVKKKKARAQNIIYSTAVGVTYVQELGGKIVENDRYENHTSKPSMMNLLLY